MAIRIRTEWASTGQMAHLRSYNDYGPCFRLFITDFAGRRISAIRASQLLGTLERHRQLHQHGEYCNWPRMNP